MGLLDIDVKMDTVVNEEYFHANGWQKYENYALGINSEGLAWKPTTSWMKQLIAEPTKSHGPIDMWVRYDESDKTLVNLLGGDKFQTDDAMTIETLIEDWFNACKRWGVTW